MRVVKNKLESVTEARAVTEPGPQSAVVSRLTASIVFYTKIHRFLLILFNISLVTCIF